MDLVYVVTNLEYKMEVTSPSHIVEKVVMKHGRAGRVYLPPEWVGRKVDVILKEVSHG